MEESATRMLWWGIGLFVLAVIAFAVGSTTSFQAAMNADPVEGPTYYWVVSPIVAIIQAGAFPLGAALIAASVVCRHINRWVVPVADTEQPIDPPHSTW